VSEEATQESTAVVERQARARVKAANLANEALHAPAKKANGATILVVTFVAFLLVMSRDTDPIHIAIVVGVLLLHEGGHLLGMRAFGFSDLKMFFLPFFGAAVSGRKPGASAVQRSIVSLLGPVPGIVIGLIAVSFVDIGDYPETPMPIGAQIVLMLVLLNGFNLVPILPLDGGRLFQTLLFSRTPILDLLFRAAAVAVLGWVAFHGMPIFGVPAFFMLVGLRQQAKVAFEARGLRRAYAFTPDVSALGVEELAALHAAAERATSHVRTADALKKRIVAQTVREIFDRVALATANWWQTTLLLLVWLLAIGAGLIALLVLYAPMR